MWCPLGRCPLSRNRLPEVLPRPRTGQEAVGNDTAPDAAPSRLSVPRWLSGRRLPHPPGRRAPLWFAALMAGALLAALPNLFGGPQEVTITASDYGLGVATDVNLASMDDVGMRQGITEAEARARLNQLAASRAAREPNFVLPLAGRETTCFCTRWGQFHPGLDIAAPLGTPIVAAADGVILSAGPRSGFGYAIYMQDIEGNVQIYGHMRRLNVATGQVVRAGDLIAWVGNEGFSTGPHLHFEIHQGRETGSAINPATWFAARGVAY